MKWAIFKAQGDRPLVSRPLVSTSLVKGLKIEAETP